jgi:aminoglycoside/choline kinase family phosphotransferase
MTRADTLDAFLGASPWASASRHPLAGDASLRHYERLEGGPAPALLVDAPPPEDTTLFVRMARWLAAQGLLAPTIHAADEAAGFLIVQDFGEDLLSDLCRQQPAREEPLYLAAVDELVRLQAAAAPGFLPPYDDSFFLSEIGIFAEWATDDLPEPVRQDLLDRWAGVLPVARTGPDVLVHRDFHALNLIRAGGRFALIDFQGARIGPAAYDLASLLVDARRDVAEATVAASLDRYLQARPHLDQEAFGAACAVLAAQRSTKILGLFRRLAKRDGKQHYLALLPRVQRQLQQAIEHPVLRSIRDWHAEHGFGS